MNNNGPPIANKSSTWSMNVCMSLLILNEPLSIGGQVKGIYPIPPWIIVVFFKSSCKVENLEVVIIVGREGSKIPMIIRMIWIYFIIPLFLIFWYLKGWQMLHNINDKWNNHHNCSCIVQYLKIIPTVYTHVTHTCTWQTHTQQWTCINKKLQCHNLLS